MANRHEAGKLLRKGLALPEIAAQLQRGLSTVIQDLRLLVGEGELKPSELFFAIPAARRHQLEALIAEIGAGTATELQTEAKHRGFTWHESHLYWQLRDPRVLRGDLYERVADLEVALHRFVREVLVKHFGENEMEWWRRGVPESVRVQCAKAHQEDLEPVSDSFAYTTLIHLETIMERNWELFSPVLPKTFASDKPRLLKSLKRLNMLRNAVMHPIKGRAWSREDLEFVDELRQTFAKALASAPAK